MKRCPVCQKEFQDTVIFCVFDGSKLEALVAQPAPAPVSFQPLADLLDPTAPLAIERAIRIAIAICDAAEKARLQERTGYLLNPQALLVAEPSATGEGLLAVKLREGDAAAKENLAEGMEVYLSPEAAQRQPTDAASDVYSIGAMLYQMLTGQPPFKASSPAALVVKQILEHPRPLKDLRAEISAELQAVVLRALEREPSARQGSAVELKQGLEALLLQAEPQSPIPARTGVMASPLPPAPAAAKPAAPATPDAEGQQDDPMIGRALAGRYRIVAKRGRGVTGTIYRAEDLRLRNRPVAVKVYDLDLKKNPAAVARFEREAQVAAQLSHPNAVIIHDFGETEEGTLYLVTEYVDGNSLAALAKRAGVLALDRVVRINSQVADVLSAAHALGMIHSDLNLNDVMVYRDKNNIEWVKVIDFGLSKTIRAEERLIAGPPPVFISPEQVAGEPVDARSDLYSLAAIVYRLLTGVLPFAGKNPQEQIIKRLTDAPRPMSAARPDLTVPLAVERVIMKALSRNPDERYKSTAEFADGLEGAYQSIYGTITGQAYIQPIPPPLSAPLPGLPAPPRLPPLPVRMHSGSRVTGALESPPLYDEMPASAPVLASAPGLSKKGIIWVIVGVLLLLAIVTIGVFLFSSQATPVAAPPGVGSPPGRGPDPSPPVVGTQPGQSSSLIWIIILIAAVAAVAGTALFLWLRRRKTQIVESPPAAIEQPEVAQLSPAASPVMVNAPPAEAQSLVERADDEQPTVRQSEAPAPEILKRCPVCETQFPGTAHFCVHDGTPLQEEIILPHEKEGPSFYDLQTVEPVKECPKCGTEYPVTKKYCRHDGELLVEVQVTDQPENMPSLMEPILVGQYSCFARLGEGGMGVVYKARHVHLNRVCAVKVLLPQVAAHSYAMKLFRREAQLASSINHPNSVTIYDYGEVGQNLLYLAMEFIQGRSLAEIITPRGKPAIRLPLARALNILRQVCDALDTAHRAGVVHRDLKPQNVMVCERPDKPELIKVVDFGIARSLSGQSGYETIPGIVGTPAYMSPEQASGAQDLDGRTDIFSLGVMAYQMLSGGLPFPVEKRPVLQQVIQRASLNKLPAPLSELLPEANLPAAVDKAIMRALEPDRDKRLKSAAEFMAEMEKGNSLSHTP